MYSKDGYKRNSKDKKRPYNIIPSGDITMKDVDFPVHGTDNLGYSQTMLPGFDYTFPGTEVFEVPLKEYGGPGGRTTALRNFMYDKKRNKAFAQEGGEEKSIPFNIPSIGKVISNVSNWKENLAENINPLTYGNYKDRIFDTIILDEKEKGREYIDRTGGHSGMKERVDLLNMAMGKPQKYNTIKESKYKPTTTKGDDSNVTYYTTQQIEDDLRRRISKQKDLEGWINEIKQKKKNKESHMLDRVMAKHSLDHGVDEDGREYISYYDKWNLNPTGGLIPDGAIDLTLGLNSPEIYGRVYLDELQQGGEHFMGNIYNSIPSWVSDGLDYTQTGLTAAGLIPKFGIIPDLINTGISTQRAQFAGISGDADSTIKHGENAALNLASAVPGPTGWAAGGVGLAKDIATYSGGKKDQSLTADVMQLASGEDYYEQPEEQMAIAEPTGGGSGVPPQQREEFNRAGISTFHQKGGSVPTEKEAQDDPRYNRDMDDDGIPVSVDIDDSTEVPHELMLIQAMKESSLDPKKISKKGAKGLTQVTDDTLTDYIKQTGDKNVDVYDWKDSMKIQNWYMNNLYNRPWINKQNQSQNVRLAKTLAAYNWGPTKFNDFINEKKNKGVDIYGNEMSWVKDLPIETRDYIKTVLLRENDEFEGWVEDWNKNQDKQLYIDAYKEKYKRGGGLLFPEWKRIKKHWKNYLSGKSVNRDMYNKMVAYGFIKKKKYRRPKKKNRSFKNISSKSILKALNLGKMKKGGSLPEQVKVYEDYIRGVFDGTDLEEKAKRTVDKINRFYYYDLKGKDVHTLDHIKSQLNS